MTAPEFVQHSHCSYCGAPFPPQAAWPRACDTCRRISFLNPIPVTIVLLPVEAAGQVGVLTVRRAIRPHAGQLALPGGYVDYGETWQEAGARELREEAGVTIDPAALRAIEVFSARDGALIIAAIAPPVAKNDLPAFVPNGESSERVVLLRPVSLAFGLHTDLVYRYLSGQPIGHVARAPQSWRA